MFLKRTTNKNKSNIVAAQKDIDKSAPLFQLPAPVLHMITGLFSQRDLHTLYRVSQYFRQLTEDHFIQFNVPVPSIKFVERIPTKKLTDKKLNTITCCDETTNGLLVRGFEDGSVTVSKVVSAWRKKLTTAEVYRLKPHNSEVRYVKTLSDDVVMSVDKFKLIAFWNKDRIISTMKCDDFDIASESEGTSPSALVNTLFVYRSMFRLHFINLSTNEKVKTIDFQAKPVYLSSTKDGFLFVVTYARAKQLLNVYHVNTNDFEVFFLRSVHVGENVDAAIREHAHVILDEFLEINVLHTQKFSNLVAIYQEGQLFKQVCLEGPISATQNYDKTCFSNGRLSFWLRTDKKDSTDTHLMVNTL